jgi:hypothetical protein
VAVERGLRAVQKDGRGRVHLTASPEGARVRTLCGRTFEPDAARPSSGPGDCQLCLRRERDPTFVSAMLFEEGRGQEVLAEALERARDRRPRPGPPPRPSPTRAERETGRPSPARGEGGTGRPSPARGEGGTGRPSPARGEGGAGEGAVPAEPEGELDPRGFRLFAERVYVSPQGTIVGLDPKTAARVSRLSCDGTANFRRVGDHALLLELADVEVEVRGRDLQLKVRAGKR